MLALLFDWLRFCRRKDSESASCLMIGLADYMTEKDRKQLADYLLSINEVSKKRTAITTVGAGDAA